MANIKKRSPTEIHVAQNTHGPDNRAYPNERESIGLRSMVA
jgi:hypothetical protein